MGFCFASRNENLKWAVTKNPSAPIERWFGIWPAVIAIIIGHIQRWISTKIFPKKVFIARFVAKTARPWLMTILMPCDRFSHESLILWIKPFKITPKLSFYSLSPCWFLPVRMAFRNILPANTMPWALLWSGIGLLLFLSWPWCLGKRASNPQPKPICRFCNWDAGFY